MPVFDLDAIKAARAEAEKVAPVVKFGGIEFTLPVELPFAIAEATTGEINDLKIALASLLGEQYNIFTSLSPSVQDINAFFEAIPSMYGLDESPN